MEKLSRYHFTWEYRPGRENIADGLSRVWERDPLSPKGGRGETAQATLNAITTDKPANSVLIDDIIAAYPQGKKWTRRGEYSEVPLTLSDQGVWMTQEGQVLVPTPELRERVLQVCHDDPMAGHMGRTKTHDAVTRSFWWPSVRRDVKRYVRQCQSCQEVKSSTQLPGGLLQPLEIPDMPWDIVTMDFILGLPMSKDGHNAIMVVVDKLTKMAHFIPCRKDLDAKECAGLFFHHVVRLHGVPLGIVSDRDHLFVGKFWRELWQNMRTELKMSSPYHPQTDGQTERVNRVLEDMLRHYVSGEQTDWDQWLDHVEFAYNNAKHESSRFTPFYMNYGFHPRGPEGAVRVRHCADAANVYTHLVTVRAAARHHLLAAQQRQKVYADEKRREVTFAPGQLVMVSTKNMRIKKQKEQKLTRKLMPRKIGPFAVVEMVGKAAVRIDLDDSLLHIHPVVHVSWLTPFQGNEKPVAPHHLSQDLETGEPVMEVERLLDHDDRVEDGKQVRYYFVKWSGQPVTENSWEPPGNLSGCQDVLRAYERTLGFRRSSRRRATPNKLDL
jgi:hypothetical protein